VGFSAKATVEDKKIMPISDEVPILLDQHPGVILP